MSGGSLSPTAGRLAGVCSRRSRGGNGSSRRGSTMYGFVSSNSATSGFVSQVADTFEP